LIADRAYDADHLRKLMRHLDGELICPHRRNRKRPSLQDGRALRSYRNRWKVERLFAWLGQLAKIAGPSRKTYQPLQRVFQTRLHHDPKQTLLKPLLAKKLLVT
jgi:transposase